MIPNRPILLSLYLLVTPPGAALAQAQRPPGLLPDDVAAARERALALVMRVQPEAGRRGESQVHRATPGPDGKGCTVNIAPVPDQRTVDRGPRNPVTVVTASPILVCGR